MREVAKLIDLFCCNVIMVKCNARGQLNSSLLAVQILSEAKSK